MLSWGWNGGSYTTNQEYGRGVLMSMQQSMGKDLGHPGTTGNSWNSNNGISINPQMFGSPAFTPGHSHAPNCPNFGNGMSNFATNFGQGQSYAHSPTCPNHGNQSQGQSPMIGGTGGVYSTGGDSPTDFTVFVGDAATAQMGQNSGQGEQGNQDYKVNFYMPQQANVSEGGNDGNFAVNYQDDGGSGDQGQTQGQQECQVENSGQMNQDTSAQNAQGMKAKKMGRNLPSKKCLTQRMSDMTLTQQPTSSFRKNVGDKYRNRQMMPKSSMDSMQNQHIYSSLRGPPSQSNSKPTFQLCGRCSKCKSIKDPNGGKPSVTNFNVQGLTPNGSRQFPIPKRSTGMTRAAPGIKSKVGSRVTGTGSNSGLGGVQSNDVMTVGVGNVSSSTAMSPM